MEKKSVKKYRVSDLLSSKIVTSEGRVLGRVADVQISNDPEYQAIALIFGVQGWLFRLHALNPLIRGRLVEHRKPLIIPWSSVASFDERSVTLKQGYEVQKLVVSGKSAFASEIASSNS